MSWWVARSNIEHFKEKLSAERDPERSRILKQLLAKEEEKLRQLESEQVIEYQTDN